MPLIYFLPLSGEMWTFFASSIHNVFNLAGTTAAATEEVAKAEALLFLWRIFWTEGGGGGGG
jgi:hypothetical protein